LKNSTGVDVNLKPLSKIIEDETKWLKKLFLVHLVDVS
jgi:hypothetical protein